MIVNWPERLYCNSPFRRVQQWFEARFLWRLRPMAPGGTILEIGCGNGAGAFMVLDRFAPRRYWGLDPDPAMLALAKARLDRSGEKRVGFLKGDAQDLPFDDHSLDSVINFGIVHHLEDWRRGLAEVARVLRPGGGFYFEEIYPALYANALMRRIVAHPTADRFAGPAFRQTMADLGLDLLPGYRESRLAILGVAVKTGGGDRPPTGRTTP